MFSFCYSYSYIFSFNAIHIFCSPQLILTSKITATSSIENERAQISNYLHFKTLSVIKAAMIFFSSQFT